MGKKAISPPAPRAARTSSGSDASTESVCAGRTGSGTGIVHDAGNGARRIAPVCAVSGWRCSASVSLGGRGPREDRPNRPDPAGSARDIVFGLSVLALRGFERWKGRLPRDARIAGLFVVFIIATPTIGYEMTGAGLRASGSLEVGFVTVRIRRAIRARRPNCRTVRMSSRPQDVARSGPRSSTASPPRNLIYSYARATSLVSRMSTSS